LFALVEECRAAWQEREPLDAAFEILHDKYTAVRHKRQSKVPEVLRVVPGEEDLHQFPQGLSINGIYGLHRCRDEPYFLRGVLDVLENEEWPRRIEDGSFSGIRYVKPSPEACARADEILETFDRFWAKCTRKPAAYRAAERAKEAAMNRAWNTLSKVY
jgi:hypothetical protein